MLPDNVPPREGSGPEPRVTLLGSQGTDPGRDVSGSPPARCRMSSPDHTVTVLLEAALQGVGSTRLPSLPPGDTSSGWKTLPVVRPVQKCWTSENLLHKPGRTRVHAGPPGDRHEGARTCSSEAAGQGGKGTGRLCRTPGLHSSPSTPRCLAPPRKPPAFGPLPAPPESGRTLAQLTLPAKPPGFKPHTWRGGGEWGGWLALWPGASHSSGLCSWVPGSTGHDAKSIHLQSWGEQGGSSYPDSIQS